jgi:pimeloyl-ACP methyl ester carboxylesterase
MNRKSRSIDNLEQQIHDAEMKLFRGAGVEVDEDFLDLAQTRLRVRVLSHGNGPPALLLHGASLSAAAWAPLFPKLRHRRLLAVDLPGHGLSDPTVFRPGQVRKYAGRLIDDVINALGLDRVPVIGHSLGAMFALWHAAAGSNRISGLVVIGEPAVASTHPRPHAALAPNGPRTRRRRPALTHPASRQSTPAR